MLSQPWLTALFVVYKRYVYLAWVRDRTFCVKSVCCRSRTCYDADNHIWTYLDHWSDIQCISTCCLMDTMTSSIDSRLRIAFKLALISYTQARDHTVYVHGLESTLA